MTVATAKYSRFREPSFLIIGAQKCGTTSLYYDLLEHPNISPAGKKEIHFFDENYEKGIEWYRDFFPPTGLFEGMITGEASPRYFFLPPVPERVHRAFPRIKLILLLRNPVDRAYSQYQHNLRNHGLDCTFEEALEMASTLDKERNQLAPGDPDFSKKYRRFSFLARGIYIRQLERWLHYFPIEQFLILKSEDFFTEPGKTLTEVFTFLGLPPFPISKFVRKNSYNYEPMLPGTRAKLIEFFRPHNLRLYEFPGMDFNWEGVER